jgi:hypothetical protein
MLKTYKITKPVAKGKLSTVAKNDFKKIAEVIGSFQILEFILQGEALHRYNFPKEHNFAKMRGSRITSGYKVE